MYIVQGLVYIVQGLVYIVQGLVYIVQGLVYIQIEYSLNKYQKKCRTNRTQ